MVTIPTAKTEVQPPDRPTMRPTVSAPWRWNKNHRSRYDRSARRMSSNRWRLHPRRWVLVWLGGGDLQRRVRVRRCLDVVAICRGTETSRQRATSHDAGSGQRSGEESLATPDRVPGATYRRSGPAGSRCGRDALCAEDCPPGDANPGGAAGQNMCGGLDVSGGVGGTADCPDYDEDDDQCSGGPLYCPSAPYTQTLNSSGVDASSGGGLGGQGGCDSMMNLDCIGQCGCVAPPASICPQGSASQPGAIGPSASHGGGGGTAPGGNPGASGQTGTVADTNF
jgi:hypothetical protein